MPRYSQANRGLQITTPLGTDQLLLAEFSGEEPVSCLFHYNLVLWSEDFAIDPTSIVGQNVTWQVALADGSPRYFNGIVSRFAAGVRRNDLREYRAEVVPTLWLLTRVQDCRIFQNQSVPDIVKAVFDSRGISDCDFSGISGDHPTLEYTVQYRETDYQFVSRLMERAGIFFYFRHDQGKHTTVLADSNAAFQDSSPANLEISYVATATPIVNRITRWEHYYEYRSGKWSQTDYNFIDFPAGASKTPATDLLTSSPSSLTLNKLGDCERYDYPGLYQQPDEGAAYTKTRMEADEAAYHVVHGGSPCAFLGVGQRFTVKDAEFANDDGGKYVVLSISHRAQEGAAYPGTTAPGKALKSYENDFVCLPDEVNYRSPRRTPSPSVRGTQTAIVVGPADEEIWTDQYGRVKVQFFWDREGVRDDNSSCWIRCAQSSAGKNWGALFLPRVGQEVVVSFIDGDLDRPLITGVVYNADQMPAYTLPDEKTKSYLKTNSSAGGDGFQEIRFEDLADSEQIFIHAQRNMDQRVLNDRMENVLNDRHLTVGQEKDDNKTGGQFEKVFADKNLHVLGNHIEQVEGNVQWTVGKGDNKEGGNVDLLIEKKKTELVEGDSDFHLKGDQKGKIDGKRSEEVVGDCMEKIGGDESLQVVGDRKHKIGGDESLNIGGSLQEKIGKDAAVQADGNVYLKGGTKVVVEAGEQLTLKVGGNFVVIDSSGVSIVGSMVKLNSGGAAGSGTAPSPADPSAPEAPADAQQAGPADPTDADTADTGVKSAPDSLN